MVVLGLALAACHLSLAEEVTITRTNWTERWITNEIKVRIPTNVFVDEFHTNWVPNYLTNVVDVYKTNLVTESLTNVVPVERTVTVMHTNFVPNYVTNVVDVYATNLLKVNVTNVIAVETTNTVQVTQYKTNWSTVRRTNELAVELVHTNFFDHWQTNWTTLTLTNWETVLLFRTNRIIHPITNVVLVDLSTNRTAARAAPPNVAVQTVDASAPAPAAPVLATWTEEFAMEATKTARVLANNLGDVLLRVKWKSKPGATLEVREWRVEREDGAILCFGQDNEFRRELPFGRYRVEVKAQADANSPLLAARQTLLLSPTQAVILPKASAMK
jgi:hypothetical protein